MSKMWERRGGGGEEGGEGERGRGKRRKERERYDWVRRGEMTRYSNLTPLLQCQSANTHKSKLRQDVVSPSEGLNTDVIYLATVTPFRVL